jgi:hypothetical protein
MAMESTAVGDRIPTPAIPKSGKSDALRGTAIHEAGHAVASFHLAVKIKSVTVVPDESSLGRVRHHSIRFALHGMFDDSVRGIDRAERQILMLWGGRSHSGSLPLTVAGE